MSRGHILCLGGHVAEAMERTGRQRLGDRQELRHLLLVHLHMKSHELLLSLCGLSALKPFHSAASIKGVCLLFLLFPPASYTLAFHTFIQRRPEEMKWNENLRICLHVAKTGQGRN